jgi:plasmid stabilization system protein ParE
VVKYQVVVTPRAQTSIRRIVDRLRVTKSRQTADHVLKGINETIKKLVTFPQSHEVEHLVSDETTEYRRILKWDYRIVYTIAEDEIIVSVVDVVSSQRGEEAIKKKFGK